MDTIFWEAIDNMDERQSIRNIAVLVGGGLKPLWISDKAEAPQGPLPRHESTRNRLPGPCGVCRSLSSRLPVVRSSFVERGALHGNCRADSCGREDVRVLRGPALGGLHAGRKAQGLGAHPVRPVVLAVREGDPAGAAGWERFDQRIMCPTCHPTIGDGDDFTASNGCTSVKHARNSEWVALEFAGLSLTWRIVCMLQSVSPIIEG